LTYKNYSVLAEDGDSGAPSLDRGVQFPCYPYIPFDGARADSAILWFGSQRRPNAFGAVRTVPARLVLLQPISDLA